MVQFFHQAYFRGPKLYIYIYIYIYKNYFWEPSYALRMGDNLNELISYHFEKYYYFNLSILHITLSAEQKIPKT